MGLQKKVVGAAKGQGKIGMILYVAFAVAVVAPFMTMGWAWLLNKVFKKPAGSVTGTAQPTEG